MYVRVCDRCQGGRGASRREREAKDAGAGASLDFIMRLVLRLARGAVYGQFQDSLDSPCYVRQGRPSESGGRRARPTDGDVVFTVYQDCRGAPDPSAAQTLSDFDPTSHAYFGVATHPGVGGGTHRRRATFERCSVFVGGVRLGVWGVVLVVCVCVGVGGVVLCRCVCVCDLLICLLFTRRRRRWSAS